MSDRYDEMAAEIHGEHKYDGDCSAFVDAIAAALRQAARVPDADAALGRAVRELVKQRGFATLAHRPYDGRWLVVFGFDPAKPFEGYTLDEAVTLEDYSKAREALVWIIDNHAEDTAVPFCRECGAAGGRWPCATNLEAKAALSLLPEVPQ